MLPRELFFAPYESLSGYFEKLTEDGLRRIPESVLLTAANQEDRIMMQMFIIERLRGHLANPFRPKAKIDQPSNALNFDGQLVPQVMKGFETNKTGIWELPAQLVNEKGPVAGLSLRANNLLDDDVPCILEAVQACLPKSVPDGMWVDLSSNRISGYDSKAREKVDSALQALLAFPQVTFVNLCANPIASVSRADFFYELQDELLLKLIWVPSSMLYSGNWTVLVPTRSDETRSKIIAAHKKFYSDDD
eukprot:c46822_g1_i1.p1 GENE.c46822_g1_i1~~c46822_g1_i1.p1  ORF type:complete len:248 (+),score=51.35 c46822_g1_i1:61-804(+)